jgi:hypothetical protein
VVEEGTLLSFIVLLGVDLQVLEEQLCHVVLPLREHAHLVRVHPTKVVERLDELGQQSEGDCHGLVEGDVVEAAFDELDADKSLHVVAEQIGQCFFRFIHKAFRELFDVAVLQQVPQQSVARLAGAVELVVSCGK